MLFLLCLFALAVSAFPMDPLAGRAAPELRMGLGARAQSMGNAQAALLEPTTVPAYWNPAMGVLFEKKNILTTGARFLTLGRREGFVSYTGKIPPRLAVNAALFYHGDFDIPIYDSDGRLEYADGGFHALTVNVALSYKLSRRLSVGANTALHTKHLFADTSDAGRVNEWELGNLDLSAFYRAVAGLSFGLTVRGLGAESKWEVPTFGTEMNTVVRERVPLDVKAGAAWQGKIHQRAFAFTLDADVYAVPASGFEDEFFKSYLEGTSAVDLHAGAECFLFPEFPIRVGYGSPDGFACGAGFRFFNGRLAGSMIDYVFAVERNGSGLMNGVSFTTPF